MVRLEPAVHAGRFGRSGRLTHNHGGSAFLGTRYFQAYPAPGRYETGRTTLRSRPLSRARPSDWTRRYRCGGCLEGRAAALSLGGADRVFEPPGPAPGAYDVPDSSFARARAGRGAWTAAFAGRVARFPPARDARATAAPLRGVSEMRAFRRRLPPRPRKRTFAPPAAGGGGRKARAPAPPHAPPAPNAGAPRADAGGAADDASYFAAPARRPPALADFAAPAATLRPGARPATAAAVLEHRAAADEFREEVRAVKGLDRFRAPKERRLGL
jgi:hypothetical protein